MTTPEWLAAALAAFNHPMEMGERFEDALVELEALAAGPPADATAEQRAMVAALRAEAGAAVGEEHGDGMAPYIAARLVDGRLELQHTGTGAWIDHRAREAHRADASASPELGDLRARWRTFDGRGPDIEARYLDHVGDGRTLMDLAAELRAGGEGALAEEIAHTALREGARYPGRWWSLIGERCLERGDLPGARAAGARALLNVNSYRPDALALMFRWYEQSGADDELLGLIYHGASAWSFDLKKKTWLGWRQLPKPPRLKSAFGDLFDSGDHQSLAANARSRGMTHPAPTCAARQGPEPCPPQIHPPQATRRRHGRHALGEGLVGSLGPSQIDVVLSQMYPVTRHEIAPSRQARRALPRARRYGRATMTTVQVDHPPTPCPTFGDPQREGSGTMVRQRVHSRRHRGYAAPHERARDPGTPAGGRDAQHRAPARAPRRRPPARPFVPARPSLDG